MRVLPPHPTLRATFSLDEGEGQNPLPLGEGGSTVSSRVRGFKEKQPKFSITLYRTMKSVETKQ